jgi:SepF-like predicted cell division protein (DUF552 family)
MISPSFPCWGIISKSRNHYFIDTLDLRDYPDADSIREGFKREGEKYIIKILKVYSESELKELEEKYYN